jgi:hypothetical protein
LLFRQVEIVNEAISEASTMLESLRKGEQTDVGGASKRLSERLSQFSPGRADLDESSSDVARCFRHLDLVIADARRVCATLGATTLTPNRLPNAVAAMEGTFVSLGEAADAAGAAITAHGRRDQR